MPARPTNLKATESRRREPLPGFGSATARIAHRFAPRPQPASMPSPLRADASRPFGLPDFGIAPRTLIASLIGLALLPNLTIAAYLWLPRGQDEQPRSEAALAAPGALPASQASTSPAAAKVHPVLSAPESLEASPGSEVPLPLALDGTDGVPARSTIAISGLPEGATLSSGRPYGENGWNLKSDEIGDLKLRLPDRAQGEAKLGMELLAPHGEVISSTGMMLKMSASPEIAAAAEEATPDTDTAAAATDSSPIPDPVKREDAKAAETAVADAAPAPASESPASPAGTAKPMTLATPDPNADDTNGPTFTPAQFVNLRSGPTSSASVLAVVPKGAKLKVLDRKRGWVKVTHPTTQKVGWIYSGNLDGSPRRTRRAAAKPEETGESFWSSVGRAFKGEPAASSTN